MVVLPTALLAIQRRCYTKLSGWKEAVRSGHSIKFETLPAIAFMNENKVPKKFGRDLINGSFGRLPTLLLPVGLFFSIELLFS